MYQPTHEFTLTGTQAGGAVSAAIDQRHSGGRHWRHHVQAAVTFTAGGTPATATAGTLSVRGRAAGATAYQELGTINLAAPEPAVFEGFYDSLQAVSTGFDSDKTWTLHTVHGD